MRNKIAQKALGYCTAIALCAAGAGYAGYKASKEPVTPKEITYVNAAQNSFNAGLLKDDPIQRVIDANKIRFEKIKANPELASYINNLERILSTLPEEYLTSTENDLYNQTNEIIQRELKKIRDDYDSPDKGRYAGAAVGTGILAAAIAGVGYLDISDKKRKEKEMKEFLSKVYKPKYERNTEPIVFVDYNSKK